MNNLELPAFQKRHTQEHRRSCSAQLRGEEVHDAQIVLDRPRRPARKPPRTQLMDPAAAHRPNSNVCHRKKKNTAGIINQLLCSVLVHRESSRLADRLEYVHTCVCVSLSFPTGSTECLPSKDIR